MSLWSQLKAIFRPSYVIDFNLSDSLAVIQGQSEAQLYKTQPHLRTVITFLADNTAQVGIKEFRRVSDTDRQRVTDDTLIRLLTHPNARQTRYELIRQLVSDLALYDSAYWVVLRTGRDVADGWEIQPIPPTWVTAKTSHDVFQPDSYRIDSGYGTGYTDVPASSMIVFHGWHPTDPTSGITPVAALKDIINEQIQAWSYRTQVWQRGGRIGTVLKRPKDAPAWDDAARERFQRGWKEFTDKGARAGSTPILEDGMELQRLGFNAREEEFSEVTKLSLQTVASVYHVSPVMVGILDNANFSNTKEFRKMLYSETLGPTMRMIEERINTFLAPMLGTNPDHYVEFDIRSKLNGDFEEQASVLSTSVGAPWITPNEARATQNLPSLEGGDQLVVPLNVTKGGQASPQDGGDPKRPTQTDDTTEDSSDDGDDATALADDVVSKWAERVERSARSRLGAGKQVDWDRFERQLQADLVAAGLDQYSAGIRANDETEQIRERIERENGGS